MNETQQSARDAARGEKIDPQGKQRDADKIAAQQFNDLKAMRKQADKLAQGWPFVLPVFYQHQRPLLDTGSLTIQEAAARGVRAHKQWYKAEMRKILAPLLKQEHST